jgi:hypothetical protein
MLWSRRFAERDCNVASYHQVPQLNNLILVCIHTERIVQWRQSKDREITSNGLDEWGAPWWSCVSFVSTCESFVCDDGIRVITVTVFLDIIHRPVFIWNTTFCVRLQVEHGWTQSIELVPISGHQHQHKVGYIVTWMSNYRRGLDWWLHLLTTYTLTTRNYTLHITDTD